MKTPNTSPYRGGITRQSREQLNGHPAKVFWFTGLSGSGKSTLAHLVEERLYAQGLRTYVLDGDNVRHGLCGDLGFSLEERSENLRRIAEVVKLFLDAGIVCLSAFISPMQADRNKVREIVGDNNFIEVYVKCPLCICEKRDDKGYYKMASDGVIKDYTGISSPYEEPVSPDLVLDSNSWAIESCVDYLVRYSKVQLGL